MFCNMIHIANAEIFRLQTILVMLPLSPSLQVYPYRQIHAPPFILSSEPQLSFTGPLIGTQTHHILLDPEEPVLFCGYCVSPDRRWMLVVCCDRQGELLDTSIIGIPFPGGYE